MPMPMPTCVRHPDNPEPTSQPALRRFLLKSLLLSCAILAIASFPACQANAQRHPVVSPGDSSAQVLSLMGPPVLRQSRGLDEAWQYKQTKSNYAQDEYQVIWFYRGMVTATTTYTNDENFNGNNANYKEIRWEDAPAHPGDNAQPAQ